MDNTNIKKDMAIIHIKDGIDYDTEKAFIDQTIEFKDYANGLYNNVPKIPYPEFDDNKGLSISYSFTDLKLDYIWKRFQQYPKSTSDRSVKYIEYIITVK